MGFKKIIFLRLESIELVPDELRNSKIMINYRDNWE